LGGTPIDTLKLPSFLGIVIALTMGYPKVEFGDPGGPGLHFVPALPADQRGDANVCFGRVIRSHNDIPILLPSPTPTPITDAHVRVTFTQEFIL